MALTIHQEPLFDVVHSGEKIIFTLKDLVLVTNNVKVKYIARVYVSNDEASLGTTSNLGASTLVATLKTNPNSSGVGIFDLSPILDNYVSPDFLGGIEHNLGSGGFSTYKNTSFDTKEHSIHVIDNYAQNQNSLRYFRVIFNTESAVNNASDVVEQSNYKTSDTILMFNAFLDHDEILREDSGNYGYPLSYNGWIMNGNTDKFLTNVPPTKQYIRENDYQTIAFFNNLKSGQTPSNYNIGTAGASFESINNIKIKYYYNGAQTGATITRNLTGNGGVYAGQTLTDSNMKLTYFGCGTANQENAGITIPSNWDYYTIQTFDDSGAACSQEYYFYKQTDDCKGFETIRLCWLNQFGVWDYYNFTKRNVRKFSKETVSFQTQEGTWNGDKFKLYGYSGGKRVFKNTATELITLNTDFITDEEAIWLEELFISNNVFIIKQNSQDFGNQGITRKYIEPVIVASEEMTRKSTANDGKVQYTLVISKSKNRRTQRT